ncbi:hypothetical protein JRI60_50020 [Archangium violaceum]|uniref:P-loop ATPase, Sll1717 family n=1 Tax=Archangium violaceum TaxID=83451 RepID=UPI0019529B97|nr:hypothetical protein [Archangium violaceum]QRN97014.1 hypothetical protein JRI60_50020 [Archangium violaceum]
MLALKTWAEEENPWYVRPHYMAPVGSALFFSVPEAPVDEPGASLNDMPRLTWRTNGTVKGTRELTGVWAGTRGAQSRHHPLGVVEGTVFFVATDGNPGEALWKSDGTAAGTVQLRTLARVAPETDTWFHKPGAARVGGRSSSQRTTGLDVFTCAWCGGRRRVLAYLTAPNTACCSVPFLSRHARRRERAAARDMATEDDRRPCRRGRSPDYAAYGSNRHRAHSGRDANQMRTDLAAPELFGNEAGEDEPPEVLSSYFLEKGEFVRFFSPEQRVAFVRSRKGMGKSALLRETLYRRQRANQGELLLYIKASDLVAAQETKSESPADLIYGWQQRICTRINVELGAIFNIAFGDDRIALVESSELAGFRNRNLISALVDRLSAKGADIEFTRQRVVPADSQALLARVSRKEDISVWLLIDDVDATFLNTPSERLRTSTFFSACRNLVNAVTGLRIRASVRADVWSILAQHDESLDKCEQYMLELHWSTTETGRILENKIISYFRRVYPNNPVYASIEAEGSSRDIFSLVFKEPFPWGKRQVEAFRTVHILSAGRPRWAAQLCKLAGQAAYDTKSDLITFGHFRSSLRQYGIARLSDISKEHRHQCPTIDTIIESFGGGPTRYSTKSLLEHITDRIIKRVGIPEIDGSPALNGSLSVANFLFRIGFIAARDERVDESLGFVRFEDRPNLLSSTTNMDDGLDWEIHPSYRDALRIRPADV